MPVSKDVPQAGSLPTPLVTGDQAEEAVLACREGCGLMQEMGLVRPWHGSMGS